MHILRCRSCVLPTQAHFLASSNLCYAPIFVSLIAVVFGVESLVGCPAITSQAGFYVCNGVCCMDTCIPFSVVEPCYPASLNDEWYSVCSGASPPPSMTGAADCPLIPFVSLSPYQCCSSLSPYPIINDRRCRVHSSCPLVSLSPYQ